MAVAFAKATCRPHTFRLIDQHNQPTSGYLSADEAVGSGSAYFGSAHPWIWAIDIDGPDHPGVTSLRAVLDGLDLESFECRSGGADDRRHLLVHIGDKTDVRDRVIEEVERAHRDVVSTKAIDWRLQVTGSAIRPPLAPHRHGGFSEPLIDWGEALATLQSWRPTEVADQVPTALPKWAEAYMVQDWALAGQLGRKVPRRADGDIDRSAVDAAIALGFRNAGHQYAEFHRARRPGGRYPSPKAVELSNADGYLWKQWSYAMDQPVPAARVRDGLDRLDEFLAVVESDPDLEITDRQMLHGIVELCRRFDKTSIAFSYRQLEPPWV